MRAHRVRFTPSRERINPAAARAIATRDGISRFKQNPLGRSLRQQAIQNAWQSQGHLCAECEKELALEQAKLRDDKFRQGLPNPVVCGACKRKHRDRVAALVSAPVSQAWL